MPFFDYNRDIPDGPHNPSTDQPDMKVNTNSTDDIIDVDHYSFQQNNGGLHKQVTMPILSVIPPGRPASSGTLYTKTGSQLYYTPDASAFEVQMTRAQVANSGTFANNTNYATNANGTFNGGWTFLPGGLLLQYGTITTPKDSSTGTATFPIAFTGTPFSITISISRVPFSSSSQFFYVGALSNTGFTFSNTTNTNTIYWMALGI